MVVQVHESSPAKLPKFQDIDSRGRVYRYIDWHSFNQAKPDFVATFTTAGAAKRRFILIETKRSLKQLDYSQMAACLRKLLVGEEWSIWQPVGTALAQTITVQKTAKKPTNSVIAVPAIEVVYENQELIETLLGEEGKKVLGKTLVLIDNTARKFKWPLHKIEIQRASDIEVNNWNYVLLVLFFDSDFDTADEYLHLLYGELDGLATTLTSEEQDILQRSIYFDVETTAMVSSS